MLWVQCGNKRGNPLKTCRESFRGRSHAHFSTLIRASGRMIRARNLNAFCSANEARRKGRSSRTARQRLYRLQVKSGRKRVPRCSWGGSRGLSRAPGRRLPHCSLDRVHRVDDDVDDDKVAADKRVTTTLSKQILFSCVCDSSLRAKRLPIRSD